MRLQSEGKQETLDLSMNRILVDINQSKCELWSLESSTSYSVTTLSSMLPRAYSGDLLPHCEHTFYVLQS